MSEEVEKEEGKGDKELHEEALERYKLAEGAWAENRKLFKEDMEFRAGDQWPADVLKDRKGRPSLVVDKVNQYIRQVVNDGRQNRPGVKVHPVDDGGDVQVAEAYQGIIRRIFRQSSAEHALDTALDNAAAGGFGFFRILTDYAHENTFNQEIYIRRIRNPLAVLLDPNIQEADGSDAKFGFIIDELTKDEYKKLYPKAKFNDFKSDAGKYSDGWLTENVRIAEYFYVEDEPGTLHLLEDGTSIRDEDYQRAVSQGVKPPAIVDSREIPLPKVRWCRLSGAEILEKQDWLGCYVPIIPVFGNEYDIDGRVIYSGLVRAAKDPQRLYNYARSAFAERVALTPKAPYIAAAGQIEGYEKDWESANTENHSVLTYNAIDINGHPVAPPQRQPASDVPSGFAQDMQLSEHDIQSSMGMYAASVGQPSNEKSGRAIMARQKEGDTSTFHYQDNLNRAICYLGKQLVDMIPRVYDSRRVIRILGEDGTTDQIMVDPKAAQAVAQMNRLKVYNLGIGSYDVSVESGPSYNTKREESAEAMMAMVQANPAVAQTHGDLIAKAQDWPGADEWAKRSRLTMPPPMQQAIAAAEGEDGENPALSMMRQQMQGMQEQMQQLQQQAQRAVGQAQAELESLKTDKALDAKKLEIEAYKAETERMQVLAPSVAPEQVAQIVQQTVATMLSQPQPGQPPGPMPDVPLAPPQQPQPASAGF